MPKLPALPDSLVEANKTNDAHDAARLMLQRLQGQASRTSLMQVDAKAKPCAFCSDGEGQMDKGKDGGQDAWIKQLTIEGVVISETWQNMHKAAVEQLDDARIWDDKLKTILKPQVEEQVSRVLKTIEEYLTWYQDEEDYWYEWFKNFKKEIRLKQFENAYGLKQQMREHKKDVKQISKAVRRWDVKEESKIQAKYPLTSESTLGSEVISLSAKIVKKFTATMDRFNSMHEEKMESLASKLDQFNGNLKSWMAGAERIKKKMGKSAEYFTFSSIEMKAQLTESLRRIVEAQKGILKRLKYVDNEFTDNKAMQEEAIAEFLTSGTQEFASAIKQFKKEAEEAFQYAMEDIEMLTQDQAKETDAAKAKIDETVDALLKKQKQAQSKVAETRKKVGDLTTQVATQQALANEEMRQEMAGIQEAMTRAQNRAETVSDDLGTNLYGKLNRMVDNLASNEDRTTNKLADFTAKSNDRRAAMRDTIKGSIESEQKKFDGRESRLLSSFDKTLQKWRQDWTDYEKLRDTNPVTKAPAWATVTEATLIQDAVDDLLNHAEEQNSELLEDLKDESESARSETEDLQMEFSDAQMKVASSLDKEVEYAHRDLDRAWEEGQRTTKDMVNERTNKYVASSQDFQAKLAGELEATKSALADASSPGSGIAVDESISAGKQQIQQLDLSVAKSRTSMEANLRTEQGKLAVVQGGASETVGVAADAFTSNVEELSAAASDALKTQLGAESTKASAMVKGVQSEAASAQQLWSDTNKAMTASVNNLQKELEHTSEQVEGVTDDAQKGQQEAEAALSVAQKTRSTTLDQLSGSVEDQVSHLVSELEAKLEKASKHEAEVRGKMETDASRALDVASTQLPAKVAAMNSEIAQNTRSQKENLRLLAKGTNDLVSWAQDIAHDGEMTKSGFSKKFACIGEAMGQLFSEFGDGADAERQLVQSSVSMMRRLVEQTASQVSDEVHTQAQKRLDQMHDELQMVLKDTSLSKAERETEYKRIQEEARKDIAELVGEVGGTNLAFQAYATDLKQEDVAFNGMIDGARKGEIALAQRNKASETDFDHDMANRAADVMRSMVDATQTAERMGAEQQHEIAAGLSDAEGKALKGWQRESGVLVDASRKAQDAGELGIKAQVLTDAERRMSTGTVSDITAALNSFEGSTAEQLGAVSAGMAAEAEKSKLGILNSEQHRDILLRELSQLLGSVSDASKEATSLRAGKLEDTATKIEGSIDHWAANGNAEIAAQMRNAHQFETTLMKNMADMKRALWDDMELDNKTKLTASEQKAEFAKMRNKLLDARAEADTKVAELEAALQKQLAEMGIGGEEAAAHLATFLHTMSFQLANGQEHGFEDLVGQLESTFGLSIKGNKQLDALLGGALTAIDKKQSSMIDLLSSAAHKLELATQVADQTRSQALSAVSTERQLEAMTDEELREKIEALLKVVEKIKQRDGVYVTEAPTPPPSPLTDLMSSNAGAPDSGFFIPQEFYSIEADAMGRNETHDARTALKKGGSDRAADTTLEDFFDKANAFPKCARDTVLENAGVNLAPCSCVDENKNDCDIGQICETDADTPEIAKCIDDPHAAVACPDGAAATVVCECSTAGTNDCPVGHTCSADSGAKVCTAPVAQCDATICPSSYRADGSCDAQCNSEPCNWDGKVDPATGHVTSDCLCSDLTESAACSARSYCEYTGPGACDHRAVAACAESEADPLAVPCKCRADSDFNDCGVGQFCYAGSGSDLECFNTGSCEKKDATADACVAPCVLENDSSGAERCATHYTCEASDTAKLKKACMCDAASGANDCAANSYCWADHTCHDAARTTCSDGIENGDEGGVDCGGSCSVACPTCSDGITNGDETGMDCGGSCPACTTCSDGQHNGDETGVDCGGSCSTVCPTCIDGQQNGDEEGVDCGGSCSAVCPTCSDGVQNGAETGVDCGGTCPACVSASDGTRATDTADEPARVTTTTTTVAAAATTTTTTTTVAATCTDGTQNGDEAGVDCGGASCGQCCADDMDCSDAARPHCVAGTVGTQKVCKSHDGTACALDTALAATCSCGVADCPAGSFCHDDAGVFNCVTKCPAPAGDNRGIVVAEGGCLCEAAADRDAATLGAAKEHNCAAGNVCNDEAGLCLVPCENDKTLTADCLCAAENDRLLLGASHNCNAGSSCDGAACSSPTAAPTAAPLQDGGAGGSADAGENVAKTVSNDGCAGVVSSGADRLRCPACADKAGLYDGAERGLCMKNFDDEYVCMEWNELVAADEAAFKSSLLKDCVDSEADADAEIASTKALVGVGLQVCPMDDGVALTSAQAPCACQIRSGTYSGTTRKCLEGDFCSELGECFKPAEGRDAVRDCAEGRISERDFVGFHKLDYPADWSKCKCAPSSATNDCAVGSVCQGGVCSAQMGDCAESSTVALTSDCACGGADCAVGKFCYGGACNDSPEAAETAAAHSAPTVCVESTTDALTESCACPADDCAVGHFCYDGACHAARQCVESATVAGDAACICGQGQWTCDAGEFCWSGACSTAATAACAESSTEALTGTCACGEANCDTGKFCYGGTCNDAARTACALDTALAASCGCGDADCPAGSFCHQDGAAFDCVTACSGDAAITAACTCGAAKCEVGKFCWTFRDESSCEAAAGWPSQFDAECATGVASPLAADCTCAHTNDCKAGQMCQETGDTRECISVTDCALDHTVTLGQSCKCAADSTTNECEAGKTCHEDSSGARVCADGPLVKECPLTWPSSGSTPLDSDCKCSSSSDTEECLTAHCEAKAADNGAADCAAATSDGACASVVAASGTPLCNWVAAHFCYNTTVDGSNMCHDAAHGSAVTACADSAAQLTAACQCSTEATHNECAVGQYCQFGACSASPVIPCPSDGAITADCKCATDSTTNECEVGKHCYDSTCVDDAVVACPTATSAASALAAACQCAHGSTSNDCAVGKFCYGPTEQTQECQSHPECSAITSQEECGAWVLTSGSYEWTGVAGCAWSTPAAGGQGSCGFNEHSCAADSDCASTGRLACINGHCEFDLCPAFTVAWPATGATALTSSCSCSGTTQGEQPCSSGQYCFEKGGQFTCSSTPVTPCGEDDNSALTAECSCADDATGNECEAGKYCHDAGQGRTCSDTSLLLCSSTWPQSGLTAVTEHCGCGSGSPNCDAAKCVANAACNADSGLGGACAGNAAACPDATSEADCGAVVYKTCTGDAKCDAVDMTHNQAHILCGSIGRCTAKDSGIAADVTACEAVEAVAENLDTSAMCDAVITDGGVAQACDYNGAPTSAGGTCTYKESGSDLAGACTWEEHYCIEKGEQFACTDHPVTECAGGPVSTACSCASDSLDNECSVGSTCTDGVCTSSLVQKSSFAQLEDHSTAQDLKLDKHAAMQLVSAIGFRKHRSTKAHQLLLERLQKALEAGEHEQEHRAKVEHEQEQLISSLRKRLPEARRTA